MSQLKAFLTSRFTLIAIILIVGGGILFTIHRSLQRAEQDKRILKRNEAHNRAINQFKSSIDNFATLVSGIKSYVELSDEVPKAEELQKFINTQLIDIDYNEELIVSFIDTNHVFQYVFSRHEIDPASLVGTSVRDFRNPKIIKELDELLQNDGLHLYSPINLKEGWVGIPLDFRVVKNGEVLGYIAPILNLRIVLDDVYENLNTEEFVLHFSTHDGLDFDRQGVRDGSKIFNDKTDPENYKNYDVAEYAYEHFELFGMGFNLGIAFKRPYEDNLLSSSLLIVWFITLIIFLVAMERQFFSYKQLNIRHQTTNQHLVNQQKKIKEQNEEVKRNLSFIESIAKISPAQIYIYDLDERKTTFENKNISQYLGYEKGKIISATELFNDHLHPDDKAEGRARLDAYSKLKDGAIHDTTIRLKDINNEWKWFLGKEVIFKRHEDGSPKQILGIAEDITEIKRIEVELAESQKKFNAAQEMSNIGHWEVDLRSRKAIVSEEFYKIFTITSRVEKKKLESNGNYFQEYIYPDDVEIVNANFMNALKTGEKYGLDFRMIDNFKKIKYVHSIVNIVHDEKKRPIKTWGTIQDISERKRAEKKLEFQYAELERVNRQLAESERNFEAAQEMSSIGHWEIDLKSKNAVVSEEFCHIFAIKSKSERKKLQQDGNYYRKYIHPEDTEMVNLRFMKGLESGKKYGIDYRIIDVNKQLKYIHSIVNFGYDDQNNPIMTWGTIQDITERKLSEQLLEKKNQELKKVNNELAESEKKLNAAQEVSNIGHWELDLRSYKGSVSEEFCHIFGIESAEERKKLQQNGTYYQKYIHPEDTEFVNASFEKGMKTGKKYGLDYRIIDANKNLKHIHSIVNFVYNKEKKPVMTWGTIQDITERKNSEQLLEEQNKELERMNAELDRFVYSVTHDLKSPLGALLGLISLTQLEDISPEVSEYCSVMESNVHQMNDFIEDLITYARNVNLEIQVEKLDLKASLNDLVEQHKFNKNGDKINFEIDIKGANELCTDASRFRIIFNNLISNAVKYHDLSKPNPYVKVQSITTEKEAIIKIADNGMGMDNSEAQQIFDMFYRAESNKSDVSGSGIGLFILNETLKKLGGNISVKSSIGKGTTFDIVIPNIEIPQTHHQES